VKTYPILSFSCQAHQRVKGSGSILPNVIHPYAIVLRGCTRERRHPGVGRKPFLFLTRGTVLSTWEPHGPVLQHDHEGFGVLDG